MLKWIAKQRRTTFSLARSLSTHEKISSNPHVISDHSSLAEVLITRNPHVPVKDLIQMVKVASPEGLGLTNVSEDEKWGQSWLKEALRKPTKVFPLAVPKDMTATASHKEELIAAIYSHTQVQKLNLRQHEEIQILAEKICTFLPSDNVTEVITLLHSWSQLSPPSEKTADSNAMVEMLKDLFGFEVDSLMTMLEIIKCAPTLALVAHTKEMKAAKFQQSKMLTHELKRAMDVDGKEKWVQVCLEAVPDSCPPTIISPIALQYVTLVWFHCITLLEFFQSTSCWGRVHRCEMQLSISNSPINWETHSLGNFITFPHWVNHHSHSSIGHAGNQGGVERAGSPHR